MTADVPEWLLTYWEQRESARAGAVAAFLDSLTERERALFCDAAVMGYVRGSMHPRGEEIPLNKPIIADVVNACLAFPDLYPAVNADYEEQRQKIEYFVQAEQPDGTWEQCSSASTDPAFALERQAARRRMHPDFECRLVRRTTTVLVEAQQTQTGEA